MLATIGTELPAGGGWVFEPKYDGIRILAFVTSRSVALVSRNGLDKTHQFPEVADALRALNKKARKSFVLDGEIVIMSGDSPLRFQELQRRMHVSDRVAIEGHREATPAALIAFDLLLDGKTSLVAEPWRVRRRHLAALLQPPGRQSSALRLSDVDEHGEDMLRRARDARWEGIIAKRATAPYEAGRRSRAWLKLKIERRQEFVVGGWTEPRRSREHIGALLLGFYDVKGDLIYAGHTGTGFTRASLATMYKRLARLERKTSPFSETPKTNEAAHWVRPEIVAEIKFNEWTSDGRLRHPVFLGVRDDKAAKDVTHEPESVAGLSRATRRAATRRAATREAKHESKHESKHDAGRVRTGARRVAASTASMASTAIGEPNVEPTGDATTEAVVDGLAEIERGGGDGILELPSGGLEVSNLGKIFFPVSGHTKGDVMRYYARVAPAILRAMHDRPLVMKRFPNGVSGTAFYQQKAPGDAPSVVRVESVSDERITTADRLIGGDLATLLYLVQLGAISVDPWHSRVGSIKHADYSIVDLDPGPRASFARVVDVALAVGEVLDAHGLHGVAKTSGASGIHIVLPLGAGVPNDGARMIAEIIATKVAQRYPKLATIERSVKARAVGAVYVDYLQNIRGKTVAGVYSVRARPTPTVSTPLAWAELTPDLDPRAFTVDTVPPRIDELGDLWEAGMRRPNTLDGILGRG